MAKIKGQNFRVILEHDAVPEETNCSVTLTNNAESSSTKDTEGLYDQDTIVSTSWNVSVDSFQAEVSQIKTIIGMFNAAGQLSVGFDQTAGSQNRTPQSAVFSRSGDALLNDVNFQFNDRQTATTTLQFQGTGALS